MKKKGFAIILVLATLVLLALLAYIYIKLALIDRNIARNYMDNKRAKLIAQSGVDYALGRLNQIIQQGWFKDGKLTDKEWVYDRENETPSFSDSRTITINGKTEKFSSIMASSTYGQNSDIFTLKVIDTQSQVNINDGSKLGADHQVSVNLKRILNILGEIVGIDEAKIGGKLGARVIDQRPQAGYSSKQELLRVVKNELTEFNKLKDFVTTHSWTSNKAAVPVPLDDNPNVRNVYNAIMPGLFDSYIRPIDSSKYYDINSNVIADNAGKKIYRYGHNRNYRGDVIDSNFADNDTELYFYDWRVTQEYYTAKFYNAVFSYDALNPQWIELTSRSPVNINTASKEVLLSLVIGLEGWFVGSRRAPNPPSLRQGAGGEYPFMSNYSLVPQKYTYDKTPWARESFGASADEIGFIYTTIPYKKSGAGTEFVDYIDAEKIVDEIIQCRKRLTSSNIAGLNYDQEGLGGPFRSWSQFNIFVDRLLESEQIIKDNRNIYKDLVTNGNPWVNYDISNIFSPAVYKDPPPVNVLDSLVQKRIARQAIADVLKANFNPNLHLNELNPDRNLYLLVDKTDLIVNSTEACFTPMGIFEIESEGYVLKPSNTDDALTASDSKIISQAGIRAIVRLYDALYHTTQRDFYGYDPDYSTFSTITVFPTTNNNYAIETGPEIDNGESIEKTEYDGYVRLSTNLGCFSGTYKKQGKVYPNIKPKGKLYTTYTGTSNPYTVDGNAPVGTSEYSADIHSHFQLDHVAHYHATGANVTLPIGSEVKYMAGLVSNPPTQTQLANQTFNFPDKTETRKGPYSPVDSTTSRYRLCNTYKLNDLTPPDSSKYAPEDLRVDGVYTEPHSAFGYDVINFTSDAVISLWIKPNWHPEVTNRVRTMLTMRSNFILDDNEWFFEWPMPFDLLYYPANPAKINEESYYNKAILFSCISAKDTSGVGSSFSGFGSTPILNHEFEIDPETDYNRFIGKDTKFSRLRSHEWTHVIVNYTQQLEPWLDKLIPTARLHTYINGQEIGEPNYRLSPGITAGIESITKGPIRIGGDFSSYCSIDEVAQVDQGGRKGYMNRIFYSDCTLDEFFFWADKGSANPSAVDNALNIWKIGRYYKPDDSSPSDAVYTSVALDLSNRTLNSPPKTTIPAPSAGENFSEINISQQAKIVGLSWTYYAENYISSAEFPVPPNLQGAYPDATPRLRPVMLDWKNPVSPSVLSLSDNSDALCIVYLRKGATDYGPYMDEGYSAVDLTLNSAETFNYKVKFRTGTVSLDTVLLASPTFDDITICYTNGVKFLSYSYFD